VEGPGKEDEAVGMRIGGRSGSLRPWKSLINRKMTSTHYPPR
jgi:hypothetical protein